MMRIDGDMDIERLLSPGSLYAHAIAAKVLGSSEKMGE